jgi:hypothetical protein
MRTIRRTVLPASAALLVLSAAAARARAVRARPLSLVSQRVRGNDRLIGRRVVLRFWRRCGTRGGGTRRAEALRLRLLTARGIRFLACGQPEGLGRHGVFSQGGAEECRQPKNLRPALCLRIGRRATALGADVFVGVAARLAATGLESQVRAVACSEQWVHARVIRAAVYLTSPGTWAHAHHVVLFLRHNVARCFFLQQQESLRVFS